MSGRSTRKPTSEPRRPSRGRADLSRLRRVTDAEIRRTSPAELANLPADFWDEAEVVAPTPSARSRSGWTRTCSSGSAGAARATRRA